MDNVHHLPPPPDDDNSGDSAYLAPKSTGRAAPNAAETDTPDEAWPPIEEIIAAWRTMALHLRRTTKTTTRCGKCHGPWRTERGFDGRAATGCTRRRNAVRLLFLADVLNADPAPAVRPRPVQPPKQRPQQRFRAGHDRGQRRGDPAWWFSSGGSTSPEPEVEKEIDP